MIAWETASEVALRNCPGEGCFSPEFYILSEERTSNRQEVHSFKACKKTPHKTQTNMYTVSQYGLKRESYHQRSTSNGIPKKAFNLYLFRKRYLLIWLYQVLVVTTGLFILCVFRCGVWALELTGSEVAACRLSCSVARWMGSNPCPLHRKVDF